MKINILHITSDNEIRLAIAASASYNRAAMWNKNLKMKEGRIFITNSKYISINENNVILGSRMNARDASFVQTWSYVKSKHRNFK
ncbi:MAG: hypothetical protein IPG18_12205 [Saprospiraceae bacterium]|nr:hypothetical protein [Saprospiraceae bacterium]MBK8370058.1 hypothetical protein [Saprospiraceae bacterium]